MLGDAIALTLRSEPSARAELFARLIIEIETYMACHPEERPWTCRVFTGTDGSQIFRGGVGHSLVIDPAGRLWRGRSYEDFQTTYAEIAACYEIATLTPLYAKMRECLTRPDAPNASAT
ncbi:hypothetical protein ELE36_17670 [Pseudolysobacter antarcticus]|uniref:Uncharacterized protein n=1 Tax=Pseudolysobacter antarcticus TaxID=2511995 RepID=A0A411HNL1_9GAMM|nr:hypothetical protein [Pseudolysobacter antarcticus]QBB72046.1 hypothetical protein ELE36_17670 [Pseudolysobacter antarcticus]